jgi:hypothetical protein
MGSIHRPLGSFTGGASGHYNYNLYYADGSDLQDVSVVIEITEDLAVSSRYSSGQNLGVGFQLNAYSPVGWYDTWQQYTLFAQGNTLKWGAENWPLTSGSPNIFNIQGILARNLPSANGIHAADCQLEISLGSDFGENIDSVTYIVRNKTEKQLLGIKKIRLTDYMQAGSSNPVTEANLAPIVAFQLVLVGLGGEQFTAYSSGAGYFTFQASQPLIATIQPPSNVGSPGVTTAENSNIIYERLAGSQGRRVVQRFRAGLLPP